MTGSTFGTTFSVTTWGESHGPAIGAVVQGCPPGIKLDSADIQHDLDRRRPGQTAYATARKEMDEVEILSGVFDGYTTGTPISLWIKNTNQRSRDYSALAEVFRPGHADYGYTAKYGFRDYRGGGRSSGRETAARVASGAIARKLLSHIGTTVSAYTYSIGSISVDSSRIDPQQVLTDPLAMPDAEASRKAQALIEECRLAGDSIGGSIECTAIGVPAGLGEPVFDKLDALLAHALFSIGGVKAVEIGSGTKAPSMRGSEHNDPFAADNDGQIYKRSNHAGGILGGISDGDTISIRVSLKPTPSIGQLQETVTENHENATLAIQGRHDPVIVPRAVVVVEAMACLVLADAFLRQQTVRMPFPT